MRVLIASTYYGFPCVPDNGYGGMEKNSWFLARELVKNGHEVTLVGGPGTALDGATVMNYPTQWESILSWIKEHKSSFDIVHDMTHGLELDAWLKDDLKVIGTLENPNDPKGAINVVVPSKFSVEYTETYYGRKTKCVYNCVSADYYPVYPNKRQRYVAQVSVMETRKGVLASIMAAEQAGVSIQLAGLPSQSPDYQRHIDQHVNGQTVVWNGQIRGKIKADLIGNAMASMLFVDWAEPGSMLGPESLALGTPLVGSIKGCVPEYIQEGVSGFIAKDASQLPEAILACAELDPLRVRQYWEDSELRSEVAAKKYEELYQRVLDGETW